MMNPYPVAFMPNHANLNGLQVPDVSYPMKPRARRELVPDDSKDNMYWMKRTKNNHAAKRSRWKRKCVEVALEARMTRLVHENMILKKELERLKKAVGEEEFYPTTNQGYMQTINHQESHYYPMVKTEYPDDGVNNVNYDAFNLYPADSGQGYGLVMDEEGVRNHLPHKLRHKLQTSRT